MPQPFGRVLRQTICTSSIECSAEPFIRSARALFFRVWTARRDVHALTFLYKLMYRDEPLQLLAILTRRQDPNLDPRTRSQRHQSHELQLCQELAPNAPNFLKRSFLHGIMSTWNSLTPKLFPTVPVSKSLQSFKMNVRRPLRRSNWLSATDSL